MYSKEFWNSLYENHYYDIPWMSVSWQGNVLKMIEQDLPDNAHTLLDYGCGNGYMGHYFYKKGFNVELADISSFLVQKLRLNYCLTDMDIIQTDTPNALFGRKYDVIIAWSLFHHIYPKEWNSFLQGFWQLLNDKGRMIISGWDLADEIIKNDGKIARYTGRETWYLNPLVEFVSDDFDVLKNDTLEIIVQPFTTKRVIRYYVLEKNKWTYKKNQRDVQVY